MGATIIFLLVVAIAMLLYLLRNSNKSETSSEVKDTHKGRLPDIIGKPKGHYEPKTISKSQQDVDKTTTITFDTNLHGETHDIPQGEPGGAFDAVPDWEEEEEELQRYAAFSTEGGLATGVTYDELASMCRLLEREALAPSEEKEAVTIISKIDGTELLNLLESKTGEASRKIAMLIDSHLADNH